MGCLVMVSNAGHFPYQQMHGQADLKGGCLPAAVLQLFQAAAADVIGAAVVGGDGGTVLAESAGWMQCYLSIFYIYIYMYNCVYGYVYTNILIYSLFTRFLQANAFMVCIYSRIRTPF